ncbi:hypothetical protein RAS2_02790 [Phycisphaerae bacterium RAS2]|nr:hypothetical protein RAS2_02790 [Phycisphaerae bacterium RAS2]
MFRTFLVSSIVPMSLVGLCTSTSHGQCAPQELVKVIAPSPAAFDWFGYAVAISGDVAAVGAWMDDNVGGSDAGSVYLYARQGNNWVPSGVIVAFDAAGGDFFGQTLAMNGNRLIVGARSDDNAAGVDAGAAYIYRLDFEPIDMTYSAVLEAKLIGSDTIAGDNFGLGVAITTDYAIVGAPQHDYGGKSNPGAAYVFLRSGTSWSQQAKLTLPDPADEDSYGFAVAISSTTALVGAWRREVDGVSDAGAVFAYARSGTTWTLQSRIASCQSISFNNFGAAIALSGDRAIVGAFNHASGLGAAYVFARCGTTWNQEAQLGAIDGATPDNFGISVAIEGDRALVGAQRNAHSSGSENGAAYMYVFDEGVWKSGTKLTASDTMSTDEFGVSVAFSNETALIGAWRDNNPGAVDSGSAYFFDFPTICDTDGDGIPDVIDACPNSPPGLPVAVDGRPLRDCNNDCNVDGLDVECIVAEILGK